MLPSSPPRQTQSYLRNLFGAHGIRPKNKLGQNFLIDLNLLDLLVRSAELSREDVVLEVGSGTGSLTATLAGQAGAVPSVALEPAFFSLAHDARARPGNRSLPPAAALRSKNQPH